MILYVPTINRLHNFKVYRYKLNTGNYFTFSFWAAAEPEPEPDATITIYYHHQQQQNNQPYVYRTNCLLSETEVHFLNFFDLSIAFFFCQP